MKNWYLGMLVVPLAVLGVTGSAFAETQNVKVSGSIDAYSFYRGNFDLVKNNDASVVPVGATVPAQSHGNAGDAAPLNVGSAIQRSDADSFFFTITQVEVSADLTDKVSTVINLINQRDWNAESIDNVSSVAANTVAATNEFDIELDLAYVQMKEIFYSPLTLTIGRQDLLFGRGFIVGWNPQNPQGLIQPVEFTQVQSFDAIRATLDFNPWTLDFVYSKILEGATNPEDDKDLYIANVNYKFAEYNAVAEGYYVGEFDRNTLRNTGVAPVPAAGGVADSAGTKENETDTIGGRVQFDPISQITLGGELAYQFGDYRATKAAASAAVFPPSRDRQAWATDIFGTYRWDNPWKPEVTLEYVHFSGEGDLGSGATGSYAAWNGLYRGHFWTAYADFREFVYATGDAVDQPATTNQDFIQVKGALKPLEDLLLEGSFTYLWTPEDVHSTAGVQSSSTRNKEIGWEIDLQATYDYTEDVSFGLLAGWFVPGNFYLSPDDATAVDLVSSVKVSF